MAENDEVRVIIFEEDGAYVAQCLEHDICAFAGDLDTLRGRFVSLFIFERNLSIDRNGAPFAGIDPAPEKFQGMWANHEVPDEMTIAHSQVVMARAA